MDIRLGPLWVSVGRDSVRAWGVCFGYPAHLPRPTINVFAGHWEVMIVSDGVWREGERLKEERRRIAEEATMRLQGYYDQAFGNFEVAVARAERAATERASAGVGPLWRRDGATEGDS